MKWLIFTAGNLKVLFDDIVFSFKNRNKFKKIAFVGENFLEKSMAEISKIFTPAETKYFPLEKREEAIEWIK